ncbi:MAG: hypothetical protein AMJ81_01910 [Phycisphaerae bacterium SM23_33]|jgi:hypothetical protein|nr:MAG: hypothetical protein AMJ81_01910 [Phycisphaerae bacterium SM23_33]
MRSKSLLIGSAVALGALWLCAPAIGDVPEAFDYHYQWTPAGEWFMIRDDYGLGPPVPSSDGFEAPNREVLGYVKAVALEVEWVEGHTPGVPPTMTLTCPDPGAEIMASPAYPTDNGMGYTYRWAVDPQPSGEAVWYPGLGEFHLSEVAAMDFATICVPGQQTYNIQKPVNKYGNLDQHDIPNIGGCACGPTAATNSLAYLQNAYGGHYDTLLVPTQGQDLDGDGDVDSYDDLIAVAQTLGDANHMNCKCPGGTYWDMFIYGKQKYMEEVAPNKTVYAAQSSYLWGLPGGRPGPDDYPPAEALPDWLEQNRAPTWQFIYDNLVACEDVEVLIEGESFGHYLTVTSFSWFDADNDRVVDFAEGATIDYIDPCTGTNRNSPIWQNSYEDPLDLKYFFEEGGYTVAQITMAMKESIPEPATLALLALAGGLLLIRRRK